jgi:hypothetical protein
MLRSIAAIICGFIVITVLSLCTDSLLIRIAPDWFTGNGGTRNLLPLVFALLYSFCFFAIGGYFTALTAPQAEQLHALVLAVLLLVMSILATIQMYDTAPLWWHLIMLIQTIPAVMIGSYFRSTRKRKFYPLKA